MKSHFLNQDDRDLTSRRSLNLNEEGQGLTEYLILLILIAVTCIGIVQTLGGRIEEKLKIAGEKINGVPLSGTGARKN